MSDMGNQDQFDGRLVPTTASGVPIVSRPPIGYVQPDKGPQFLDTNIKVIEKPNNELTIRGAFNSVGKCIAYGILIGSAYVAGMPLGWMIGNDASLDATATHTQHEVKIILKNEKNETYTRTYRGNVEIRTQKFSPDIHAMERDIIGTNSKTGKPQTMIDALQPFGMASTASNIRDSWIVEKIVGKKAEYDRALDKKVDMPQTQYDFIEDMADRVEADRFGNVTNVRITYKEGNDHLDYLDESLLNQNHTREIAAFLRHQNENIYNIYSFQTRDCGGKLNCVGEWLDDVFNGEKQIDGVSKLTTAAKFAL